MTVKADLDSVQAAVATLKASAAALEGTATTAIQKSNASLATKVAAALDEAANGGDAERCEARLITAGQ